MHFECIILDKNEIVKEGTSKVFHLTSYHPETKNDEGAKYRKIFIDYEVLFKNGEIIISMEFLDKSKIIKRIDPVTTNGVVLFDTVSVEKIYYISGSKLYFLSNVEYLKSWYLDFDEIVQNISISNKFSDILGISFYVKTDNNYIEVDNKRNPLLILETQPLIEDKIEYKTEWGRRLIRLSYNKRSQIKESCNKCS